MTAACDASTSYYADYSAIIHQLRCPVCDGQRISSSDATFALSVKRDVCGYVQRGMGREDVIGRIEQDYGQSMRVESGYVGEAWPLALGMVVMLVVGGAMMRRLLV